MDCLKPTEDCTQRYGGFGTLCGHSDIDYAEAALMIEPRGAMWCKEPNTIKAALYRAFGAILSKFEQRLCDLFNESLACNSVELLSEFETMYGLPPDCSVSYQQDLTPMQNSVCAARRGAGLTTMQEIQEYLRTALDCEFLTIENVFLEPQHAKVGGWTGGVGRGLMWKNAEWGGVCISGITSNEQITTVHNTVGSHAETGAGQPLTLNDPDYIPPQSCPFIYHSTVGGWAGGVGQPLQFASDKYDLLVCLMNKIFPAHIKWTICN